ncbi:hypothetical protein KSC_098760 [Ktedonobacter sp. SOSP1-52]|uniref:hypothetical protein n=1 Tax=Ktedonobacter sp. SOSP1-52 TaxID=2778366 RepID=UPI001915831C|nr:hypothetical protein [Ktedonobacter sp. SOSP1-52]GHO70984.1 hypothetical protein KSC_098760 [Ktedonobacter sp. SOSP1-52]
MMSSPQPPRRASLYAHLSIHPGRKRYSTFLIISLVLLVCIVGGTFLTLDEILPNLKAHAAADSAILTYKGDNNRTGAYANETTLNKSNVNASQFGRRVSYPVDGQVYAQPLFVPNLTIGGATHNVVFVETEHDGVYAFDADQTTPTQPLWYTSFLKSGVTSVPSSDVACNDMVPEIGITGTPVIDSTNNIMYVMSYTKENGVPIYRLHALDISTGQDKIAPSLPIQGSVAGTGAGSTGGQVAFRADRERNRSALLLANGQIYIAFASFCDNQPYHGWIMSYSTSLQQTAIYNNTPNGSGGGIWGAGNALASDSTGNIYTISGNGDFDINTGGKNNADSFVKLSPQLQQEDYFAPFNQKCLQNADADLGSGGPLQIPGTNEHIGVGKEGRIYVVDNNNMGKYTPVSGTLDCNNVSATNIDQVKQELPPHLVGGVYSTPTYWNNNVYFTGASDSIKAFSFNPATGLLSTSYSSKTPESFAFTGGGSVTSSNGTDVSTAIVWALDPNGLLRAYDATNLGNELYSDSFGQSIFAKFTVPAVANGEVFVGTKSSLLIYGLKSANTPTPTPSGTSTSTPTPTPNPQTTFNNVGITDDTNPGVGNFDGGKRSYSLQALQNSGLVTGDNVFFNNMVFTWPNAVAGTPDDYLAQGQTVPVAPIANANVLGFLGASANGPTSGRAVVHYTDGTSQGFTLGFSDWTLGGGKSPVSFGNGKKAIMAYRNTPNGLEGVNTYVFYADVALQDGKTVQSVTLPSTVVGGQLHVFSIATKVGTVSTPVSPNVPYNNVGTSDDGQPKSGSFDGLRSYSAQAMQSAGLVPGSSLTAYGTTFVWPASDPGTQNNYIAQGQKLAITPVDNASTLAFLGAATNGPSSGQATITYTDTTTQTFILGFSDWTLGANAAAPSFNNLVVTSAPYRNTPTGKENVSVYVFYTEVGLQAGKTIASVTLPSSVKGGQTHVFAVATKANAPYATNPYSMVGTSNDNNTRAGNYDGGGYSYSAQALQGNGIKQGGSVFANGASFIWPAVPAGAVNNYVANGQTIPVNGSFGSNYLTFLGSSTNGATSGTVTITYTDGTTDTGTLGFSDWTLNAGRVAPSFGNLTVSKTTYRNGPNGKQSVNTYVFYTDIPINPKKTVLSVTLPTATTGGGRIHVFSVATR